MAATDLFDAAAELLGACEGAVATTPGGAIERAYVSPALPAFDCCPQLTVHVGGVGEGDTAPLSPPLQPGHRAQQSIVPLAQLTVTVIRCVPIYDEKANKPPAAADIQAAAALTHADLWAIWNELRRDYREGSLFAGDGCSREFFFDAAFPVNTSGGCAGWLIPFRVGLGGY